MKIISAIRNEIRVQIQLFFADPISFIHQIWFAPTISSVQLVLWIQVNQFCEKKNKEINFLNKIGKINFKWKLVVEK